MAADASSVDALYAEAYRDLKRLAHARLRGNARGLLDTTALVHESYLRLSQSQGLLFPDRLRFMAYAGRVMRSVIVDLVRQAGSDRRGGDLVQVTLTGDVIDQAGLPAQSEHILRVHEALTELERMDPRMAQVVELRYFAGLSDVEIAQALGVTDRTVRRDWQHARLALAAALK